MYLYFSLFPSLSFPKSLPIFTFRAWDPLDAPPGTHWFPHWFPHRLIGSIGSGCPTFRVAGSNDPFRKINTRHFNWPFSRFPNHWFPDTDLGRTSVYKTHDQQMLFQQPKFFFTYSGVPDLQYLWMITLETKYPEHLFDWMHSFLEPDCSTNNEASQCHEAIHIKGAGHHPSSATKAHLNLGATAPLHGAPDIWFWAADSLTSRAFWALWWFNMLLNTLLMADFTVKCHMTLCGLWYVLLYCHAMYLGHYVRFRHDQSHATFDLVICNGSLTLQAIWGCTLCETMLKFVKHLWPAIPWEAS